jgi:hypothetical protein
MREQEFQAKLNQLQLPETDLKDFSEWSRSFLNADDARHEYCEQSCINDQFLAKTIERGFYKNYNYLKPTISEDFEFINELKGKNVAVFQTQWLQCAKLIASAKSARKMIHHLAEDTNSMISNLSLLTRRKFVLSDFELETPFTMLGDLYSQIVNISIFRYSHYAHVLVNTLIKNKLNKVIPRQVVPENFYFPVIFVADRSVSNKIKPIMEVKSDSVLITTEGNTSEPIKGETANRPITPDPDRKRVSTPTFSYFDLTHNQAEDDVIEEKSEKTEEVAIHSIASLNLKPSVVTTTTETIKIKNVRSQKQQNQTTKTKNPSKAAAISKVLERTVAETSSSDTFTSVSGEESNSSDSSCLSNKSVKTKRQLSVTQPEKEQVKSKKPKEGKASVSSCKKCEDMLSCDSCSSHSTKKSSKGKKLTKKVKSKSKSKISELNQTLFEEPPKVKPKIVKSQVKLDSEETRLNPLTSDEEEGMDITSEEEVKLLS